MDVSCASIWRGEESLFDPKLQQTGVDIRPGLYCKLGLEKPVLFMIQVGICQVGCRYCFLRKERTRSCALSLSL